MRFRHIRHQLSAHRRFVCCLVVVLLALAYFLVSWYSGDEVWLPSSAAYATASDDQIASDLPIKVDSVTTSYGRATRYTSKDEWQRIYEFHASPTLSPSTCPNIMNTETLLPSGCEVLGYFHSQPVFGIRRSLPSGASEYFVRLGKTFVYIKSGGDGGQSLSYLNTFISTSPYVVGRYLADNNKRVNAVLAKRAAAQAATDRINALAYTHLDFSPAIPTSLPAGWRVNKGITAPIELDGPDAAHPQLVDIDYTDKTNKQFVSLYALKLSASRYGALCGPTPGDSMADLDCHLVAGTGYYEATLHTAEHDFIRYLYYPVGDSMVITVVVFSSFDNQGPDQVAALEKIQETITLSAQQTDKHNLKGSMFHKVYYWGCSPYGC